ncbi:MAG: adenylosuccinate lyase [Bdellovibrionales bacterium]|nr:adenylosuccinate lyase [Bdellovibrionales bacterium]
MIPRYSREEMQSIWTDENRFKIWLEVETLALEGMVNEGKVPKEALADVKSKGNFDKDRVLEIENDVKHDVIAFLTNVAEYVGPSARFVHRGMTSSDLLDTSLAVQLKQSGDLLLSDLKAVCLAIKKRAEEYKYTPCVGRSHGIHAEPITFGLKLASWYAELKRAEKRLKAAIEEISVGKIAGAVGTYASISPKVEAHVMETLGLEPETVPTQIVHRDRHASFFSALALLASSIERFSIEIRHLQRTEVREAEEKFTKDQKGSSAMPHKRNPILTENLCGLARLVRSYATVAMENVPLWHERDISHSSAERVIAPDACIITDFMLVRFKNVVEGLVVHEERMLENLEATRGLVFSGSVLLTLVDNGVNREDAYRMVQKHALAAWEGGADLRERIITDKEISATVSKDVLEEAFSLDRHIANVDLIFQRTFNE